MCLNIRSALQHPLPQPNTRPALQSALPQHSPSITVACNLPVLRLCTTPTLARHYSQDPPPLPATLALRFGGSLTEYDQQYFPSLKWTCENIYLPINL